MGNLSLVSSVGLVGLGEFGWVGYVGLVELVLLNWFWFCWEWLAGCVEFSEMNLVS